MDKWLELHKLIYEIPYHLVRGMKDMRSVLVNKDVVLVFAVDISTRMAATVNDKYPLTSLTGTICHYGAIQAGTDNQQIIFECRIQNAKFKIILLAFSHWPLVFF